MWLDTFRCCGCLVRRVWCCRTSGGGTLVIDRQQHPKETFTSARSNSDWEGLRASLGVSFPSETQQRQWEADKKPQEKWEVWDRQKADMGFAFWVKFWFLKYQGSSSCPATALSPCSVDTHSRKNTSFPFPSKLRRSEFQGKPSMFSAKEKNNYSKVIPSFGQHNLPVGKSSAQQ